MDDYQKRQHAIRLLMMQGESDAEAFFFSVGLSSDYRAPAPGWGRQKRLITALSAAEERGDLETVLNLIEERFGSLARSAAPGNPSDVTEVQNSSEGTAASKVGKHGGVPVNGASSDSSVSDATTCVFVVHGQNKLRTAEVARLVERVGEGRLEVIVLEEQPSAGQTVIEKFEGYAARAGFAIVLMTADDLDFGSGAGGPQEGRARQNVVFELGYFMGTLGRRKVVLLADGRVALPTQVSGVIHTLFDEAGAWKHLLTKEMSNAGLKVDFSKIA